MPHYYYNIINIVVHVEKCSIYLVHHNDSLMCPMREIEIRTVTGSQNED